MVPLTLEEIIRSHVMLPSLPSSKGWYHILCKVCNDHGRKGKRGGFKFEGDSVSYNCFNCGHTATFNPHKHSKMPSKMKTVLDSFNIPKDEWQQVIFASLRNKSENGTVNETGSIKKPVNIEPITLPIPSTFYYLKNAALNDALATAASEYLQYVRGIDPKGYPFMVSTPTSDPGLKKWMGRVIIPIYKDGNLIYYQGRDLTDKKIKKYESPSSSKDTVLFGFDELFRQTDEPLYIVEGIFDAMMINGVAIIGNKLSQAQIMWLNRSQRKKVYIPDKFGDGYVAALQAIDEGWSVSTPEVGGCKDMNAAVIKYGKLYVMKTLADNTHEGFSAEVNVGIYCEQRKKSSTKS